MEKSYKHIVYFVIAISILTFIGFFRTYFSLFPSFDGINTLLHIHAFAMITWIGLLIVQPVLINQKQFAVHRFLGKITYVLAPVIFILMQLVYRHQYFRLEGTIPHTANLGLIFMQFTDTFPFIIIYILAVAYRKDIPKHMRFMISSAILIVGAGLTRILVFYVGLTFEATGYIGPVILLVIFLGFMIYDALKGKPVPTNAFTIATLIFLIPNILWVIIPPTAWWQITAQWIVDTIY